MEFKVIFLQQKQFENILVVIQAHTDKISKQRKTENYQTEKSKPVLPRCHKYQNNKGQKLHVL
jgi:hypothetical protein